MKVVWQRWEYQGESNVAGQGLKQCLKFQTATIANLHSPASDDES